MIVVTTPTGQIGRQVLDLLLDAPEGTAGIRVIARDPARLPARVRAGVEVVRGSHADPTVLKEACAGADRVFWLVPPTPSADSVEGHFRDFTEPLREVIGDQGVQRVVAVSTLGRSVAENAGLISASLAMDEAIADTGVHYRALCPPFLMENLLGQAASIRDAGAFFLALAEERVLRTCATGDIAAAAARLLLDDSWTGQEDVPLVGPDDLSPAGMAQVISEVLERPVRIRRTSSADYRATMLRHGASEAWAQGLADMTEALNTQGFYGADVPSTPEAAPTGFRQWCQEMLRPAVLA
ncbi:NAD(P)H-binding protein [Streptomyces rectiviolaceus]|uniref:NAD(P)H-binding protein n=1 Tax=Streptomyces rectiviolaceus TaxID=332591 RepID=A0ABP6M9M7_9ACTN